MRSLLLASLLSLAFYSNAQDPVPDLEHQPWEARWITVPGIDPEGFGVYYFRLDFDLEALPSSFLVHVSADNRYKLFINGQLVSLGPARGDLMHWNYETVDLAPYLSAGANVVAAQVWNEGAKRPMGQISRRTAFILQGATEQSALLNTGENWLCARDNSYAPLAVHIPAYYVSGPGEEIDMSSRIKDWADPSFEKEGWLAASELSQGLPRKFRGQYGNVNQWLLRPSTLPQMELSKQRLASVSRAEGIEVPEGFPATEASLTIPANSTVSLLLDQRFLTNAYPTLRFSGGKDGSISLRYQEALFTKFPFKGNRDKVEGKTMVGRQDLLIPDGSMGQEFTSLSWRTYRYIQMDITTGDMPLVLEDIYGTFTGYPFEMNARLDTDSDELQRIMEVGWRTARLCAVEHYMDCPYYEQLQYFGDTRIQALVSLYNSGDERLVRNALDQAQWSQEPEGLTGSRYPSSNPQFIPTFSLWYIGMLHDYLMYGSDRAFVQDKLPGARQVLHFYSRFQDEDGSLKDVPYWMFTDWVDAPGWARGVGPMGQDGSSAILDLQLLWAYQVAAELEIELGLEEMAEVYLAAAERLKMTISARYWDQEKQLFADRPEKDLFSQHAGILAILTGMVSDEKARLMGERLLEDSSLAPASIYFKYYLHLALTEAGLGNEYLDWLDLWRLNLELGLTTWAEDSDVNTARSDCHAWGSSPNIEFFRIVLGIDSDAPGFSRVRIEPHLGDITEIGGEMPHPLGTIKVHYILKGEKMHVHIELPQGCDGVFIREGIGYPLHEGTNSLKI